jgi:hypothetical protein
LLRDLLRGFIGDIRACKIFSIISAFYPCVLYHIWYSPYIERMRRTTPETETMTKTTTLRLLARQSGNEVLVFANGQQIMALWCPASGGYVRDVTYAPGITGQQVSWQLATNGDMMTVSNRSKLLPTIKHLLRRKSVREQVQSRLDAQE